MPILTGDIKLVASQVMDDVPEGGGAPTATVIADGTSNAIFPDISELDRAGGRVNLRKLHVSVQTMDTDTYMGSNIIVSEPPADPNVSVTLFSNGDTFDRRGAASGRVESYLNKGPEWAGMLLENHIVGQRVIQLAQRVDAELPNVGQTLVLIMNEGTPGEYSQYVRTTAVVATTRVFYDAATDKEFPAVVVSCSLSDALRYDFTGSPVSKGMGRAPGACKLRDTVVSDAGTYVGVTPLAVAADLGDYTVTTASIYTQLVPSAQTETPISDVRSNGLSTALAPTGGALTQTLTLLFTTSAKMFVGGPIFPGSLTIARSGIAAVDTGGLLTVAGAEVGQVDYDNGIVSLSSNVWGSGAGGHTVTFIPAAVPDLISAQRSIRVTAESRSLSYVFTLADVPLPRTLTISYLAQGRWYVLRDNGAGVLKGVSSAFGVGTLSYTTGSVVLTLGALPDTGSSLILQSYSAATTVAPSNTQLSNGGRLFVAINSSGELSTASGTRSLVPGAVALSWGAFTAEDDGEGELTGDASGTVSYATGVLRFSPNTLPAPGTVVTVVTDDRTQGVAVGVLLAGGNLGATNITPRSLSFPVFLTITYSCDAQFKLAFTVRQVVVTVYDAAGNLYFSDGGLIYPCGTVNYTTGAIAFTPPVLLKPDFNGPIVTYKVYSHTSYFGGFSVNHYVDAQIAWNGTTHPSFSRSAAYAPASDITYSNSVSSTTSFTVTLDNLLLQAPVVPNYVLKGVSFNVGSTRYQQLTDGTLVKDVYPSSGGGTPAGSVSGSLGLITLSGWPSGQSSLVGDWRGLLVPPSVGVVAPFSGFSSTFRTSVAPIRPGSLSVLGTLQDGTTFNVTAGADGTITAARVKGRVDYQYGIVELYFVNPAGDVALNTDLTHLGIAGLGTVPADLAMLNSIRYNAVSYSYLPLDSSILGIDPVRLPTDGRVPIFRPGGFVVVGNTASVTATVANAQTINCARVRLSRVRVIGNDGAVIHTGYEADLEAGTVRFTNVSGYSQPVTIEHRIEDMAVVSEMQISGELTFTRPLTHDYPITSPPSSFVSSALIAGDLKARVSVLFDQATWNGTTWLNGVSGTAATGTFNDVLSPIVVTNKGAVSERWALVFTNTTSFNVIGEHVGVIAIGSTNTDISPNNPATNTPYFKVPALGWGIGWAAGNILRFNTVGAMTPVWVVRTIQQGPNTGVEHSFTLLSRGDVNRP
jgi:hypothetical protein